MKQKIDKILLLTSLVGYLVLSISFLLMPIEKIRSLPGLLFGLGLFLGITCQIVLDLRRKQLFIAYGTNAKRMQKARCGLLDFGTSQLGRIADISTLCSAIFMAIGWVVTAGRGYICYVGIALTVFSFAAHCVFNGRNYFHVKNLDKLKKMMEEKVA